MLEMLDAPAVGQGGYFAGWIAQLAAFRSETQPHIADGARHRMGAGLRRVVNGSILIEPVAPPRGPCAPISTLYFWSIGDGGAAERDRSPAARARSNRMEATSSTLK